MNLEGFTHLVSAYGADPLKWPDATRGAAQIFAANNKDITQGLLNEARSLDDALSFAVPSPPSDLLQRRILSGLDVSSQNDPADTKSMLRSQPSWRSIAAMVACAFGLGFAGAQFMLVEDSGSNIVDVQIANTDGAETDWQLAAYDLGLVEVYNWVEGTDVSSGGL